MNPIVLKIDGEEYHGTIEAVFNTVIMNVVKRSCQNCQHLDGCDLLAQSSHTDLSKSCELFEVVIE